MVRAGTMTDGAFGNLAGNTPAKVVVNVVRDTVSFPALNLYGHEGPFGCGPVDRALQRTSVAAQSRV
ncbi:hypothetical protein FHX42_002161 [Saccharopolyspora lacisalsi]|uniref:Uncharacterized protein n=1 Tax=Halosaccharopolyspora lacisalsi TaxID=1000566 RepID=A0A839DTI6_9PSEU|nr:hypothetical protein [Halosaccharopolyspora lacisalsi]